MNKDELKAEFEKNVDYLRRNIPPDDIYLFCEQTFMAAMFFMKKWSDWEDINDVCKNDIISRKWISNIIGLHVCREKNLDITLDLDLKSVEE